MCFVLCFYGLYILWAGLGLAGDEEAVLRVVWPAAIVNVFFQIINTYTEAVQTVDPKQASGKPHTLWVEFAKFYENADQIEDVSQRIKP